MISDSGDGRHENNIYRMEHPSPHCTHASLLPLLTLKRHEQFSNHIVNRTSEMRKVIWGCIHTPTGFSGSENAAKKARVDYFFALLDSGNRELVRS
jgi:hypothetical protein